MFTNDERDTILHISPTIDTIHYLEKTLETTDELESIIRAEDRYGRTFLHRQPCPSSVDYIIKHYPDLLTKKDNFGRVFIMTCKSQRIVEKALREFPSLFVEEDRLGYSFVSLGQEKLVDAYINKATDSNEQVGTAIDDDDDDDDDLFAAVVTTTTETTTATNTINTSNIQNTNIDIEIETCIIFDSISTEDIVDIVSDSCLSDKKLTTVFKRNIHVICSLLKETTKLSPLFILDSFLLKYMKYDYNIEFERQYLQKNEELFLFFISYYAANKKDISSMNVSLNMFSYKPIQRLLLTAGPAYVNALKNQLNEDQLTYLYQEKVLAYDNSTLDRIIKEDNVMVFLKLSTNETIRHMLQGSSSFMSRSYLSKRKFVTILKDFANVRDSKGNKLLFYHKEYR